MPYSALERLQSTVTTLIGHYMDSQVYFSYSAAFTVPCHVVSKDVLCFKQSYIHMKALHNAGQCYRSTGNDCFTNMKQSAQI